MTPAERGGVLAVARGVSAFEEHQAWVTEERTRTMNAKMRADYEAAKRKAFGKR
ncbi:MAG TPA: hypothetical protein VLV83_21560 [Acidobacteriota bacterium]|nr:hypothetical protein [Acidobacteriota bacterium]